MNKVLLLSSLLFILLAGCNGINKDLQTKGEEIVKIINTSHESLLPFSDEETMKVNAFFVEYPTPSLESSDFTKEESFIFNIEYLRLSNVIYINSLSKNDMVKAEENLTKYKELLSELQNEFNISVN